MTDTSAQGPPLVTGSEIARLVGVTRAAVSNWRRRYDDFPTPAGGGVNSPLFDLAEVQAWLGRQRNVTRPHFAVGRAEWSRFVGFAALF
ncbi:putative DNA-binding transcriptional regulator AlpA [Streptomyces aurantiacus]|nr:putative DNA-binding transcriptional regulator AlpA [Streptomyces aurantiacus]